MLGAQKAKPAEQLAGFYRSGGAHVEFAETDDDLIPMHFKAA